MRMIVELRHLPCEERLQSLKLMSTVTKRLRWDMIKVYKLINGFDSIDQEDFFVISQYTFGGHNKTFF